jgi:hypothetical protein
MENALNGWIDPVGRLWTDSAGTASPIGVTEQGRYVCPLCLRDHLEQSMSKLPLEDRFYCPQGHQLAWGKRPKS